MPKISVILPTYCHANSVGYAIQSVLDQTYRDFELIIIDDASVDGTQEILEEFKQKDSRIKVYRNQVNSGCPARNCNEAIKNYATGEYIAFQFDDDYWFSWCLEALIKEAEDVDFLFGQTVYINYDTKIMRGILGDYDFDKEKILLNNRIANNAIMMRRATFLELGGYDETPIVTRVCDWELYIRIYHQGYRTKRIPQLISVCYTSMPGSVGVTFNYDMKQVKEYIRKKIGLDS